MKYTIEKLDEGFVIRDSTYENPVRRIARTSLDEALGTLRELFEPEKQYPKVASKLGRLRKMTDEEKAAFDKLEPGEVFPYAY